MAISDEAPIVIDELDGKTLAELIGEARSLSEKLAGDDDDKRIYARFFEALGGLDINGDDSDKTAYKELGERHGEDIRNVVYDSYRMYLKQFLAPIFSYAQRASSDPELKAVLDLYVEGAAAGGFTDSADFEAEYVRRGGNVGRTDATYRAINRAVSDGALPRFSEFVSARVDLDSDAALGDVDRKIYAFRFERFKPLYAELREISDDRRRRSEAGWEALNEAGEGRDFEDWDDKVRRSFEKGEIKGLADATDPEVYETAGFFRRSPRQYRPRQFVTTSRAWVEVDFKPVEVEIPAITLKTAKYKRDYAGYADVYGDRDIMTDPEAFKPLEINVFNFSPRTIEELELFRGQLGAAQVRDGVVRVPIGPPPNWLLCDAAKYEQVKNVVERSAASFESRGVHADAGRFADLYGRMLRTEVGKAELMGDAALVLQRMQDEASAREARTTDEERFCGEQIRGAMQEVSRLFVDFDKNYRNDEEYKRLAGERAAFRNDRLQSPVRKDSFRWKMMVEEQLAGVKLEYEYKAVVLAELYKDIRSYLAGGGDPSELFMNLDYSIEERFRALVLADLGGMDLNEARAGVHAMLAPFMRMGFSRHKAASESMRGFDELKTTNTPTFERLENLLEKEVRGLTNEDTAWVGRYYEALGNLGSQVSEVLHSGGIRDSCSAIEDLRLGKVTHEEMDRARLYVLGEMPNEAKERVSALLSDLSMYQHGKPGYVIPNLIDKYGLQVIRGIPRTL